MSKTPTPSCPELNRLRAAAGLIPIIEAGLANGKLSIERAALMASFCEWAVAFETQDVEQNRLLVIVVNGLERLQVCLSLKGDIQQVNGQLAND